MQRAESLRLYRDILRSSRLFVWKNTDGQIWRDILRENTRKEYEHNRFVRDPLLVAQLLFVGRDCLEKTNEKYLAAKQKFEKNIDDTRNNK